MTFHSIVCDWCKRYKPMLHNPVNGNKRFYLTDSQAGVVELAKGIEPSLSPCVVMESSVEGGGKIERLVRNYPIYFFARARDVSEGDTAAEATEEALLHANKILAWLRQQRNKNMEDNIDGDYARIQLDGKDIALQTINPLEDGWNAVLIQLWREEPLNLCVNEDLYDEPDEWAREQLLNPFLTFHSIVRLWCHLYKNIRDRVETNRRFFLSDTGADVTELPTSVTPTMSPCVQMSAGLECMGSVERPERSYDVCFFVRADSMASGDDAAAAKEEAWYHLCNFLAWLRQKHIEEMERNCDGPFARIGLDDAYIMFSTEGPKGDGWYGISVQFSREEPLNLCVDPDEYIEEG